MAKLYTNFDPDTLVRLKNPSAKELDDCFNKLLGNGPKDSWEAVMIYYIGHGAEYRGQINAILLDGENNRRRTYELEKKAN